MYQKDGPKPKYRVFLLHAKGRPGFVGISRQDRVSTWHVVWQHRHQLGSRLAEWFKTLNNKPPDEFTVIGTVTGLHRQTARAIARLVAAWFPGCVTEERKNMGKVGRRVGRVELDGRLTVFPSVTAAAAAMGTSRFSVYRRLAGRPSA